MEIKERLSKWALNRWGGEEGTSAKQQVIRKQKWGRRIEASTRLRTLETGTLVSVRLVTRSRDSARSQPEKQRRTQCLDGTF